MLILNQLTANFIYKVNFTHIQKVRTRLEFLQENQRSIVQFFYISFPNFVSGLGFPSFQNPTYRAVIILNVLSPNEILLSSNTLIVLLKYITLVFNILWTNSSALTSLDLSALDSQLLDLQFFFRTHDIVLPFCICFVKNSSFCNVQYNFG